MGREFLLASAFALLAACSDGGGAERDALLIGDWSCDVALDDFQVTSDMSFADSGVLSVDTRFSTPVEGRLVSGRVASREQWKLRGPRLYRTRQGEIDFSASVNGDAYTDPALREQVQAEFDHKGYVSVRSLDDRKLVFRNPHATFTCTKLA